MISIKRSCNVIQILFIRIILCKTYNKSYKVHLQRCSVALSFIDSHDNQQMALRSPSGCQLPLFNSLFRLCALDSVVNPRAHRKESVCTRMRKLLFLQTYSTPLRGLSSNLCARRTVTPGFCVSHLSHGIYPAPVDTNALPAPEASRLQ